VFLSPPGGVGGVERGPPGRARIGPDLAGSARAAGRSVPGVRLLALRRMLFDVLEGR
jgi:hypothetical protein